MAILVMYLRGRYVLAYIAESLYLCSPFQRASSVFQLICMTCLPAYFRAHEHAAAVMHDMFACMFVCS